MASIFGGFGAVHELSAAPGGAFSSVGGVGGGGGGGFPGIFPGGGVSNSGWAGLNELQNRRPCTPEDVRQGRCTMGPPPSLSGRHRPNGIIS